VLRVRATRGLRGYEARDTFASLAMGVGYLGVSLVTKAGAFGIYAWLHQLRVLDLGAGALAWPALILADDFCYYWFHRLHHEMRLLWAAHVNHHSSRHFNLSTALRQSWTTPFTAPLFWAPLPLLGFEPAQVFAAQALSLVYQFWIHSELIPKLGPLELVLNTPSHHRVHHGRNVRYLDKNYGGILIVWDRLFGSFEPEREPVDYGITKNLTTFHPVRIAFHEWLAMLRDVRGARSPLEALRWLLEPPGWSPDGSSRTARQLQRALASE
jgi:sterol desaturase/sphingolipid hydroxylase (fatty acid hydroxylase superfamily)